jgi:CMP-2-keto-3-deoxyoctulosonic acid synthetase
LSLSGLQEGVLEQSESIEQMRIIENGFDLISVEVEPSLPSVNELTEADSIDYYVSNDAEQKMLLDKVLSWPCKR